MMRLTNNIGFILLAIYLILIAVTTFVPGLPVTAPILALLALFAGVFILIGR